MQFRNYVRKRTIWLEWQKVLFPETKELIYAEVQLKRFTQSRIYKNSENIDNCNFIFKHTTNPATFFKYLKLYFESRNELTALEPYIDKTEVFYPEDLYHAVSKQYLITQFLHKYGDIYIELSKSKTHWEHEKLWHEFYHSLKDFDHEMNLDNINYYMNLYNVNIIKYKSYSPGVFQENPLKKSTKNLF